MLVSKAPQVRYLRAARDLGVSLQDLLGAQRCAARPHHYMNGPSHRTGVES